MPDSSRNSKVSLPIEPAPSVNSSRLRLRLLSGLRLIESRFGGDDEMEIGDRSVSVLESRRGLAKTSRDVWSSNSL